MSARLANAFTAFGRRVLVAVGLLSLGLVAVSHGAESGTPVKLRFGGDQTETRIVLEVPRAVQATPTQAQGQSLSLDFAQLNMAADLDGQGRGLVKTWSLERSGGKARLLLQLTRQARIKRRFLLPPGDGLDAYRYVLDLEPQGGPPPAPAVPAPAPRAAAAPGKLIQAAAPSVDGAETASPVSRALRKVIVIDAGHGGHDPGALGAHSKEKDITLAAAMSLKARLEKTGRFRIVLTRDSDVFVPLENRVQIARAANADLFISLHADVGSDPAVRGATVYTLSDQGEDRVARGVFEGGSFLKVQLPGRDQSVKQILLDLTQRATRNRSAAFAETLIDQVGRQTNLVSRSHRDAGYVVLLAPDVPAVLLEMGFITNRKDETELTDSSRRARLMNAVAGAIEAYFSESLRYAAR
jgi:N-acetylmuramoyl-L-alanine amidase